MKHVIYITLATIFFGDFPSSANSKLPKGCTYTCTHEVSGNVLTIKTLITYGPDCNWPEIETTVEFGDGATASWEESGTHTHYYCCDGPYHVSVKAPDINISQEFLIYIGDSTAYTGDSVSVPVCVPDFSCQKSYDNLNKKFMICCVRRDTCSISDMFWYATGQPPIFGDSVVILYPQVDSGELQTICLERNTTEYGNPVCKEVLLSVDHSTSAIDSVFSVHTFPNPVHDNLQVEIVNLKGNAFIAVYSLDGRKLLDYGLKPPSITKSEFAISTQDLSTGIYLVKIVTDANSCVKKIVKE